MAEKTRLAKHQNAVPELSPSGTTPVMPLEALISRARRRASNNMRSACPAAHPSLWNLMVRNARLLNDAAATNTNGRDQTIAQPTISPHKPLHIPRLLLPLEPPVQEHPHRSPIDNRKPHRLKPQSLIMLRPKLRQ
jgi:hypothetical protein